MSKPSSTRFFSVPTPSLILSPLLFLLPILIIRPQLVTASTSVNCFSDPGFLSQSLSKPAHSVPALLSLTGYGIAQLWISGQFHIAIPSMPNIGTLISEQIKNEREIEGAAKNIDESFKVYQYHAPFSADKFKLYTTMEDEKLTKPPNRPDDTAWSDDIEAASSEEETPRYLFEQLMASVSYDQIHTTEDIEFEKETTNAFFKAPEKKNITGSVINHLGNTVGTIESNEDENITLEEMSETISEDFKQDSPSLEMDYTTLLDAYLSRICTKTEQDDEQEIDCTSHFSVNVNSKVPYPESQSKKNISLIGLAAILNRKELFYAMLKQEEADINNLGSYRLSQKDIHPQISNIIIEGSTEIIKVLVNLDLSPNWNSAFQDSYLSLSGSQGQTEILKFFLEQGNYANKKKNQPFIKEAFINTINSYCNPYPNFEALTLPENYPTDNSNLAPIQNNIFNCFELLLKHQADRLLNNEEINAIAKDAFTHLSIPITDYLLKNLRERLKKDNLIDYLRYPIRRKSMHLNSSAIEFINHLENEGFITLEENSSALKRLTYYAAEAPLPKSLDLHEYLLSKGATYSNKFYLLFELFFLNNSLHFLTEDKKMDIIKAYEQLFEYIRHYRSQEELEAFVNYFTTSLMNKYTSRDELKSINRLLTPKTHLFTIFSYLIEKASEENDHENKRETAKLDEKELLNPFNHIHQHPLQDSESGFSEN